MKKILPLIGVILLLLSCSRVERIQSLSQLEPALRKYVGNPCKIDTIYKTEYFPYSGILYQYEEPTEVTFSQLITFLSKAYNHTPVLEFEEKRQTADFKSESEKNSFELKVYEYNDSKKNKRCLDLMVVDVNNELVIPSSPAPQRVAPSK